MKISFQIGGLEKAVTEIGTQERKLRNKEQGSGFSTLRFHLHINKLNSYVIMRMLEIKKKNKFR